MSSSNHPITALTSLYPYRYPPGLKLPVEPLDMSKIDAFAMFGLGPAKQVELTYDKMKGLFKKCIGKKNGKPRIFWLGRDQYAAAQKAGYLQQMWHVLSFNSVEWTDEAEKCVEEWLTFDHQQAKRLRQEAGRFEFAAMRVGMGNYAPASSIDTVDDTLRPRAVKRVPAAVARELTLGKAAEDHLAYLRTRRLSEKYVARTAASFKQMHEVLPKSLSLRDLDKATLVMFTGHFLKRPRSKITGEPMSPDSIRTLFGDVKRLLEALDGEGWDGPKKWQRLFNARWTGLLTPAEQRKRARGKDTFTFEELKILYDLANPRQRMLMLLALNTAMNQKEISTLLRDDINFEAGVISRIRHKTRAVAAVQVQWTLWPAAATAIEQHLAPLNEAGLAFLTEENNPLVNDATDTDSIALSWTRLLKTAKREGKEVRTLPFGTLRKTASTAILNLTDESTQQQLLGHAPRFPRGKDTMAVEPIITCPTCRAEIKLTESLAAPLIAATKQQYEQKLAQQNAAVAERERAITVREEQIAKEKESLDAAVDDSCSPRWRIERQ